MKTCKKHQISEASG